MWTARSSNRTEHSVSAFLTETKAVVPNLRVGTLPVGHKLNLTSRKEIVEPAPQIWILFLWTSFLVCEILARFISLILNYSNDMRWKSFFDGTALNSDI